MIRRSLTDQPPRITERWCIVGRVIVFAAIDEGRSSA
jgi:hypothetical protein